MTNQQSVGDVQRFADLNRETEISLSLSLSLSFALSLSIYLSIYSCWLLMGIEHGSVKNHFRTPVVESLQASNHRIFFVLLWACHMIFSVSLSFVRVRYRGLLKYIFIYIILACQPGVARAFALRAELWRFAPPAGSAFSLRDHSSQRCTLGKIAVPCALLLRRCPGICASRDLYEYFALLCTCVSFEKSQLRLVTKGSD